MANNTARSEQEKKRFFECAGRLSRSRDPEEQKRLKEQLARMTFGQTAKGEKR